MWAGWKEFPRKSKLERDITVTKYRSQKFPEQAHFDALQQHGGCEIFPRYCVKTFLEEKSRVRIMKA